ncbi:MAG: YbhB/YbcL family Raf kinase inhibitor-like protein [Planctomycetes bacterium]|nr:YbhB/YbcL family Raf kinase inhibitor-like protein [Planctomycetota bacterium]
MFETNILLLICISLIIGCSRNDVADPAVKGNEAVIKLTSPAFRDGGAIPAKYTADGQDISPALAWVDVPTGTKTFVLVCDDPDAPGGTWVHWLMYNIPVTVSGLPDGVPVQEVLDNGAQQGKSDFKRPAYGGPAPPSGTHRYFFKLYALDSALQLEPKTTTKDVLVNAMAGHIIGKGQLMGTYRSK